LKREALKLSSPFMAFDPDSAATSDSGLYGLPYSIDESRFVIVPVPFDATTSYRDGTRNGPAAVFEASRQVDLFDVGLRAALRAGHRRRGRSRTRRSGGSPS